MDIMLDLETYGRKPGCAIRSIGAVAFTLEGGIVSEGFYRNINDRSCWLAGLRIEKETAGWWELQGPANDVFKLNQLSIGHVVREFHRWFHEQEGEHLWCQGFDELVWNTAARVSGCYVPWNYWQVRDTRTLYHLAGYNYRYVERTDRKHHALDDAFHQVRCVHEAYRKLGGSDAGQLPSSLVEAHRGDEERSGCGSRTLAGG